MTIWGKTDNLINKGEGEKGKIPILYIDIEKTVNPSFKNNSKEVKVNNYKPIIHSL